MMHLPMPDDFGDAVIRTQCAKAGWAGFRERWMTATAAYRSAGGDPWVLTAAAFNKAEKLALASLYDTRRSSGAIKRIRSVGYESCPMCGSSGGRSLDHALPRSTFPEFSIVRENLVPACTICNTDEKGSEFRGTVLHERLIHPYYDKWAASEIWEVEFGEELDAVVFRAVPNPLLGPDQRITVAYHLSIVLGNAWEENTRRYWGTLPSKIQNRLGVAPTVAETRAELAHRLHDEQLDKGINGWASAFLRGALNDDRIPIYLAAQVRLLPAPFVEKAR